MNEWLALPREWLAATGEIGRFSGNVVRDVWGLRVFRFFGEALRQCGHPDRRLDARSSGR